MVLATGSGPRFRTGSTIQFAYQCYTVPAMTMVRLTTQFSTWCAVLLLHNVEADAHPECDLLVEAHGTVPWLDSLGASPASICDIAVVNSLPAASPVWYIRRQAIWTLRASPNTSMPPEVPLRLI